MLKIYVNVCMAIVLIHWLSGSCFFLNGYDVIDFLHVHMR
jgi:hypothetical protein